MSDALQHLKEVPHNGPGSDLKPALSGITSIFSYRCCAADIQINRRFDLK